MKLRLEDQSREQELEWMLDDLQNMHLSMDALNSRTTLARAYTTRAPVQIVTDYLAKIRECVVRILRGKYGDIFDALAKEIILLYPIWWSPKAINHLYRASTMAGFSRRYFKNLEGVFMLPKSTAAALYSIYMSVPREEHKREEIFEVCQYVNSHRIHANFQTGECFILLHLGESSTCCNTFIIDAIVPTFKIRPILHLTRKGGATEAIIYLEFVKLLYRKMGVDNFMILSDGRSIESFRANSAFGEGLSAVIKQFQDEIAKDFDGYIEPTGLTLPGDLYELIDAEHDIIDGEILLTNADVEEIFASTINTLYHMIDSQMHQIHCAEHTSIGVFVSGTFSQHQYIQDMITELGRQRHFNVYFNSSSSVAAVRGAINHYQHSRRVIPATKSYGIVLSQPFSEYLHEESNVYEDSLDNKKMAKNQVMWLVRAGDMLYSDQPTRVTYKFCLRFGVDYSENSTLNLVKYSGAVEDIYMSHHLANIPTARRELISLTLDLNEIPSDHVSIVDEADSPYGYTLLTAKIVVYGDGHGSLSVCVGETKLAKIRISRTLGMSPLND